MKKFNQIMLAGGVTLALGGAVATNLLTTRQQEQFSDLTLANIEALAVIDEGEYGLFQGTCSYVTYDLCSVTCPRCGQVTYASSQGSGTITGGYCSNCFYVP